MVLKQFIVNNYTFERSLEDHNLVTILKELDTDKEAEEEFDATNDDNNDIILMIDEHEDDVDHVEDIKLS